MAPRKLVLSSRDHNEFAWRSAMLTQFLTNVPTTFHPLDQRSPTPRRRFRQLSPVSSGAQSVVGPCVRGKLGPV